MPYRPPQATLPTIADEDSAYEALHLVGLPLWVFDIDRRRVHWANRAALAVWQSPGLDELRARDLGADMSESVARRLAQYQADFVSHGAEFHEQWTLYPAGQPVAINVTFRGHRLADGRMAMWCEGRPAAADTPESVRSVEALLHTAVMISLYDGSGRALYRNPAAREAVRSPEESLDAHIGEGAARLLRDQLRLRGVATLTLPVLTALGARWHELSARACRDAVTGQAAVLVSEADVTLLKESEAQANYLAVHDPLTGLPNRSHVRGRFADAVRDLPAGTQAALVVIDLDHFKDVNDTLGHAVGDELLVEVAQRLRAAVRRSDLVARFGGDEFLILVAAQDIVAEVERIHARIRDTVSAPLAVAGRSVRVTATLGVALFPHDGADFETLLRSADLAMYSAKEGGRDALAFYREAMGQALRARTELEGDLRHALEQREFEVFYQPRVLTASGRIVGAEALVRWRHPARGLIEPDAFIPLCESTGMVLELDRQVFATAAAQLARWQALGRDLVLSVNVSPRAFSDPHFAEQTVAVAVQAGCDLSRLELEITESMLLDAGDGPLQTLRAISASGMTVSLDDFGRGYSNLATLSRFPIHALKIDRAFIAGLDENQPVADLIAQLCRLMKLRSVAEGVETEAQRRWAAGQGIEQAQGYLFAPPLPLAEFEALLDRP